MALILKNPDPQPEPTPAESRKGIERLRKYLEEEYWPKLPEDVRGKGISKEERERLLGYGPEGV